MDTDAYQDLIRPALSATGRLQCPVADRVEWGKGAPLLSDGAVDVCTRTIFLYSHESKYLGKYLIACKRGGT